MGGTGYQPLMLMTAYKANDNQVIVYLNFLKIAASKYFFLTNKTT